MGPQRDRADFSCCKAENDPKRFCSPAYTQSSVLEPVIVSTLRFSVSIGPFSLQSYCSVKSTAVISRRPGARGSSTHERSFYADSHELTEDDVWFVCFFVCVLCLSRFPSHFVGQIQTKPLTEVWPPHAAANQTADLPLRTRPRCVFCVRLKAFSATNPPPCCISDQRRASRPGGTAARTSAREKRGAATDRNMC